MTQDAFRPQGAPPIQLRLETADKRRFMPLLLIGDEQPEMVERYLDACVLYVGSVQNEDMAVCAVCEVNAEDAGRRTDLAAGGRAENADGAEAAENSSSAYRKYRLHRTDTTLEIKNIAIAPAYRRQGYGRHILQWLASRHAGKILTAGTGEAPTTLNFYRNCGFYPAYRVPDFFINHYDHAIVEEGVHLKDMVYFRRDTAIRRITAPEQLALLPDIWEAAVRDSHDFLTESDLRFFRTQLPPALPALEVFGFFNPERPTVPTGFIALDGDKIDMLFIHPDNKHQGCGSRLIDFAIRAKGIRYVDVNEQNPKALDFYQHKGFEVSSRDALDPSGKPFPILHLTLKRAVDTFGETHDKQHDETHDRQHGATDRNEPQPPQPRRNTLTETN